MFRAVTIIIPQPVSHVATAAIIFSQSGRPFARAGRFAVSHRTQYPVPRARRHCADARPLGSFTSAADVANVYWQLSAVSTACVVDSSWAAVNALMCLPLCAATSWSNPVSIAHVAGTSWAA